MNCSSLIPRTILFILFILLSLPAAISAAAGPFRGERITLSGDWKFELRHDNPLTRTGPVRFGPVSASSQALFLEPWIGQSQQGRYHTSTPWPLAATLTGTLQNSYPAPGRQIWRPHPQQEGPSWWQADFGAEQTLVAVEIQWARSGEVKVTASLSADGKEWAVWAAGTGEPEAPRTLLRGKGQRGRYLRLDFLPAPFAGTGKIDIAFLGKDGSSVTWAPVVQRSWYEDLRRFVPQDGFPAADFDDRRWPVIHVPGYWEVRKFSPPTWWHPDDAVGCYRRTFSLPESWKGRAVRLRFEGVNNAAQVWLNGREVGYHESGFTAFEYDITPHLLFGKPNTLAVRVSKWTLTHDYDTDDVWFLGGIWREAYLYALPATRIDDYTIRTGFDSGYKNGRLRVDLLLKPEGDGMPHGFELEGQLFDSDRQEVAVRGFRLSGDATGPEPVSLTLTGEVDAPHPWSAETPYLYTLLVRLKQEGKVAHEFSQPFGFRQVEVRGSELLLNGRPIRLRGVVTTRANPNDAGEPQAEIFAREIRLLKEANINAIRSHTTPLEEEFLDLCDRYGIYVMPDVPYVWVREEDYRFLTDGIVERAADIYRQHRNRTSVILWHIGNENGASSESLGMGHAGRWLHVADPTRPVMACSNRADLLEFGTAIHDDHYNPIGKAYFREPTAAPVIYGEFHALPELVDRLRDRGLVESWGRSLRLEWAEFEKRPWVAGGLICCWDDGSVNGDIGPRQWGVLDSRRQAKGVHAHIRRSFSPLTLQPRELQASETGLKSAWALSSRNSFTDLAGYTFRWELLSGSDSLGTTDTHPRVEPGRSAEFPLSISASRKPDRVRVSVTDPQGFSVMNEEFRVPAARPARTAAELLERISVKPGNPLSAASLEKMQTPFYRVRYAAPCRVELLDRRGRELFTVQEVLVSQGRSWNANLPLGEARCLAPQTTPGGLSIPFEIQGSLPDQSQVRLQGALQAGFASNAVRFSYRLETPREITIRETGVRVHFPAGAEMTWNRDALLVWPEKGLPEGNLETAPPAVLERLGSLRKVFWLSSGKGSGSLFLHPNGESTNLRALGKAGEVAVSDYLGGDDFLGRFDFFPVDRKLAPGAPAEGGFTVHFLSDRQARELAALPPSGKDFTWPR